MSTLVLPTNSIRTQRQERSVRARADARAHIKARTEPLIIFLVVSVAFTALGVRTTVDLHNVYPDAVARLAHAYIAWWNHPPRFRAVGFAYPPLQTISLLPLALLRPLATSMVALPLFSAICAGFTVATLDRTLVVLDLAWWIRLPLLVAFTLNPLFLAYGSNGMATCLEMALLAAALHHFTAWYVQGASSVRSLAWCGLWLAIGLLARYETVLWLGVIVLALPLIRWRRGARMVEILALEAILVAPMVYTFLVWSGVSSLVGGGGFLSWITRAGAEQISGLGFDGRATFGARASGITDALWRISPLLLIVPALLVLAALALRRPILLVVALMVVVGAVVAVVRMDLHPNAELLQPAYEMVALVPMLIGAGWLISLCPPGRVLRRRAFRGAAALAALAGLVLSLGTADAFMKVDDNVYDQSFHSALASNLQRISPSRTTASGYGPASLYTDDTALGTFLQAAIYTKRSVLIDESAFPGLILARNTTAPFRTRAADGDRFWDRALNQPRANQIEYLVVANPNASVPGYPRDRVSERYPSAYSGKLVRSQVIFRDPLMAVVQLLPRHVSSSPILPTNQSKLLQLYQRLPSLSQSGPQLFASAGAPHGRTGRPSASR